MASNTIVRGTWGSVAAQIDPNLSPPGAIAISILAGDPINVRRLFAGIFAAAASTVNWRVLIFKGVLPADITAFSAWDAVNGLPANSATVLGVDVQFEAVVPSNTLLEENISDDDITGPIAISGETLTMLVVPLVTGSGLAKAYIALSAYGGPANPTQNDRNYRSLARFPASYSPQSD